MPIFRWNSKDIISQNRPLGRTGTEFMGLYTDFYSRSMFLMNCGKSVKGWDKKSKPTRHCGYRTNVVRDDFCIGMLFCINGSPLSFS